ncbi:MAG: pyrroline-5-carboxylate reductase [Candidatus Margulisbacteria bacterium]|nr:pyrroline-5-carboxylate reductase [Candidatus Margulisiibacteriota bacterium]
MISFIGAGRMAESLISRLGAPQNIIVSDISKKRLAYLKKKYRVKVAGNNLEAFQAGSVIVLAVKPQNMADVLAEVAGQKLVISIAAGIPLSYLQKKLPRCKLIRAMPNNPCLAGHGMTALTKGKGVTRRELRIASKIFGSVGEVAEVPEKWMDAVTGLSGSGPAFIYLVMEAMMKAGESLGIEPKVAERLSIQTVLGSARTMLETGKSARELRAMVASPGGTTIEGLKVLEKGRFFHDLMGAVRAAAKKSKVLSKKWTS